MTIVNMLVNRTQTIGPWAYIGTSSAPWFASFFSIFDGNIYRFSFVILFAALYSFVLDPFETFGPLAYFN